MHSPRSLSFHSVCLGVLIMSDLSFNHVARIFVKKRKKKETVNDTLQTQSLVFTYDRATRFFNSRVEFNSSFQVEKFNLSLFCE